MTMAGGRLDGWAGRSYRRFRYGPGACKVDYVLCGPMPWTAEAARQAGTLHLGGDFEELVASERAPSRGQIAERPFVLVTQPTVADPAARPAGTHVAVGLLPRAPGLAVRRQRPHRGASSTGSPRAGATSSWPARCARAVDLAAYNPNYVGGDIVGGAMGASPGRRPAPRCRCTPTTRRCRACCCARPRRRPAARCHGMCGWHAAGRALRRSAPDAASLRPSRGTAHVGRKPLLIAATARLTSAAMLAMRAVNCSCGQLAAGALPSPCRRPPTRHEVRVALAALGLGRGVVVAVGQRRVRSSRSRSSQLDGG